MLPIYFHKKYQREGHKSQIEKPSVYIMVNNKTDMLPDEIRESKKLIGIPYGDGFYLTDEDLDYIRKIKIPQC